MFDSLDYRLHDRNDNVHGSVELQRQNLRRDYRWNLYDFAYYFGKSRHVLLRLIIRKRFFWLLDSIRLGGTYPSTISLYLVDFFSVKYCSDEPLTSSRSFNSTSFNQTVFDQIQANHCSSKKLIKVLETFSILFS